MSLIDEADTVQRAISGDHEAVANLLEHYAPLLRRRLAGRIDTRWQGILSDDDVLQETYIDVFLGISDFVPKGEHAFLRWITTLARNNLLDAVKGLQTLKKGRGHHRVLGAVDGDSSIDLLNMLGGTVTSPSLDAARREANRMLKAAISKLPEADAAVVRQYDLEGRPIAEVADSLGCSQGAVFMRRSRAHQRLREILGSSSHY
ncbi:MAG: RNA polymerase sigma factor [Pirellulaceae bacterium]